MFSTDNFSRTVEGDKVGRENEGENSTKTYERGETEGGVTCVGFRERSPSTVTIRRTYRTFRSSVYVEKRKI